MSSSDISGVSNFFSVAAEGFITTTSNSIISGAAVVPLNSVSGLTDGNVFVGIIEPGQTNEQTFTGLVDTSGVQITNVVWTRNANVGHSAGVTVVDYVTGTGHNMMTAGILVAHNQDGTFRDGVVSTAGKLATGVVTTAKIADSNVTATKLADSAINQGYSEITTNFTTITTSSDITVSGLSTTASIPSASRRVKVTVSLNGLEKSGAPGDLVICKIFEDSTQKREFNWNIPGSNYSSPFHFVWSGTTTVASHTYSFTVQQGTAGTVTVVAGTGGKPSSMQVTLE